ncbi:MAG: PAS domain S-box protein [Melioribacteraceae bacterium]|nr:PAS domain S-box protein [Melioribacteraceae bacterium]
MEKDKKEKQSQNGSENSVTHLQINIDEVYEFIEDKSILDILESVKQAYPFTFIGRQKFKRKIDQLGFEFWIKDANEKIIIVNTNFADALKRKTSEVEGKTLSEIYSEKEYQLVKNITNYIVTTSNSVLYEVYSNDSVGDLIQTVEFPIRDIDGNVVAIIGFKQKAFKLENLLSEDSVQSGSVNIEEIPAVVIQVSSNFLVQQFSNKFYKEFKLNPTSIMNKSLQSIFNVDFSKLLLSTTPSNIRIAKAEYGFEFQEINNDPSKGYYFSFNKVIEKHTKAEASSKTFDMVMYTSPDPMFIYSVDNLKFLKVNEAALKFYGYREDEFLGMDLTDLYAPEDIQTLVDSASRNTIERGFTGPWRQKKKDGSNIKVEISKSGIEFNEERAHFIIVKDISHSLESDRLSSQFQSVLDNSTDLIIITDADGFIKKVSKSTSKVLGYDKADLDDRPFLTLVTDEFRAKINTNIFHSAAPEVVDLSCDIKKADNKAIAAHIVSTPIFGGNSNVELILIVISLEKEVVVKTIIKKEIIKESGPLQNKKNSLDPEFLSHLFHELLTPVNVIIGFAQDLADSVEELTDDQKESVEIIKQNQRTLLQLMDNAIQYTELEKDHVKLNPTSVHFVELIDQIENDIAKVSSNLEKEFSYGKISSSLKFETDKSKLQSLISLLIEFAMRATKNEKIYLSAYQTDPGHCVISVKDDRNSISKELLENLQEIFRADENTIRHKYGISRFMLRFAIKVSHLISESKGAINKYGEPTEFGFTFPIRFDDKKAATPQVIEEPAIIEEDKTPTTPVKTETKVEPTIEPSEVKVEEVNTDEQTKVDESTKPTEPFTVQVNVNTQSNSQQNVQPVTEVPLAEGVPTSAVEEEKEEVTKDTEAIVEDKEVNFENLSCLYVEDQIDSQILFKVQMKGLKTIEFANSFEKAIPLLQSRVYDFIIMDINLQGEYNGLDALRAIQKMESHKDVPIVAVTAYVLPGDRERFITAGFTDFISKPILRDKLESVLNNIF